MGQHHRRLPKHQRADKRANRKQPARSQTMSPHAKPQGHKSLFASFSSEKEVPFFS
jgi:hypothetical protein